MKFTITTICALFMVLVSSLFAADPNTKGHQYEGKISGLFCEACASKVKASLGKLDGVTKVKITNSSELGVQKILIDSASSDITKEAAIKALGEDAKSYTILSLEKVR